MKLIRKGGLLHKDETGYCIRVDYHYEGEFQSEPGFTGAQFDMIIPLEVGDRMTVDQLYAEACRRVDLIKGLL